MNRRPNLVFSVRQARSSLLNLSVLSETRIVGSEGPHLNGLSVEYSSGRSAREGSSSVPTLPLGFRSRDPAF